jgi:hypothetical protein
MCSNCKQQSQYKVGLLIVILLLALYLYSTGVRGEWILIGSLAAAYIVMIMFKGGEHLTNPDALYGETAIEGTPLSIDTDDRRFSEFGNISLIDDIDSTHQRRADLIIPSTPDVEEDLDNGDMVGASMLKHSSLFLPNNAQGVTPTSSAYMSSFTLGEPDPGTASIQYSVPLDDSGFNLDQALARGQQHRASINKRAIDGAVRATKNLYKRVFGNELAEHEEREWWGAQSTTFETDFRPYY